MKVTLLGLLLLGLTLLTGALYFGAYHGFSAQGFETTIQSWGAWGVFGSIVLMIVHSFVPFPAEFLAMAKGMVHGPVWGTVITWATGIGILPFTVLMVVMGNYIDALTWELWVLIAVAVLVGWLLFRGKYRPGEKAKDHHAINRTLAYVGLVKKRA